jgi:REP element-mobilizing transposase RayT
MSASRPSFVAGEYYHLYNRGAHRASIFREPANYLFVIRLLKKYCAELLLTPIVYCLMPNHYHFVTRQDGDRSAGLLPQRIFNSYVKAYNKRYEHTGTMFEAHFKAIHITNTPHLLQLCRYVHANPVKDGLVGAPEDWPYSNYLEWIGERRGTLVDRNFIADNFSSIQEYKDFVQDYLRTRQLPEEVVKYLDE